MTTDASGNPLETETPCTRCGGSGIGGPAHGLRHGGSCMFCGGTGRAGPSRLEALNKALDVLDAATVALDRYGRLKPRTAEHLNLIEAERAAERRVLYATRKYLQRPDVSLGFGGET